MLKDFFRGIILSKNETDKNKTINILKECYEKDLYKILIKEEILEKEYDYFA